MPSWPPSLPQYPLWQGYQQTLPDLLIRSPTTTGPHKVRARATSGVSPIPLTFRMTPTELTAFRTFFATDLKNGVLSFTWTNPAIGTSGNYQIVSPPVLTPLDRGLMWDVSLELELLP